MELATAVRARRSTAPVSEQAPTDAELLEHLQLAAHSPDHAGLRPWRMITVRGQARHRLGDALVAGYGDIPGTPEAAKTAGKVLRAPLLISIVAVPAEHPKVPRWEQFAAIGALVDAAAGAVRRRLHRHVADRAWRRAGTGPAAARAGRARATAGLALRRRPRTGAAAKPGAGRRRQAQHVGRAGCRTGAGRSIASAQPAAGAQPPG